MINILILGDNHNELILLSENIRRCDESSMCIVTTSDVQEALAFVDRQSIIFDIFIVNMRLSSCSGYAFESKVRRYSMYKNTPFIFLTKNKQDLDSYSYLSTYEAYKMHSYVLSPLDPLEVQSKFCLYLDSIFARQVESRNNNKILRLKRKSGTIDIPVEEILYLEIQNKICTIYSLKGKFFIRRVSLAKILNEIDASYILRCHRFYAVNTKNIDYIENINSRVSIAHLKGGYFTCPISKNYFKN